MKVNIDCPGWFILTFQVHELRKGPILRGFMRYRAFVFLYFGAIFSQIIQEHSYVILLCIRVMYYRYISVLCNGLEKRGEGH